MSDLSTAALKKIMPQADPGTDSGSKKIAKPLRKDKTIGGRTEIAKRQQQKKGIPKSYWNNQEKQAQSFTDTSKMNRNKPKYEDEGNAIFYDKQTKKRKTIPFKDSKKTDIQISYPSGD